MSILYTYIYIVCICLYIYIDMSGVVTVQLVACGIVCTYVCMSLNQ